MIAVQEKGPRLNNGTLEQSGENCQGSAPRVQEDLTVVMFGSKVDALLAMRPSAHRIMFVDWVRGKRSIERAIRTGANRPGRGIIEPRKPVTTTSRREGWFERPEVIRAIGADQIGSGSQN